MLGEALSLAERGWPVFPCSPQTKAPLLPNDVDAETGRKIPKTGGVKKASADPDQIRAWWQRWPKALIGVATGHGRLFVLDFDPRIDPITGEIFTLERLKAELEAQMGCALPKSLTSITQSDGVHVWFCWPDDGGAAITNRGNLPLHVDVRGLGGYVIAPPSVMVSGNRYRWHGAADALIAEAPAALVEILRTPGSAKRAAAGDASDDATARRRGDDGDSHWSRGDDPVEAARRKWALAALDSRLTELAQAVPGQRGSELNRIGFTLGQLVGAGVLSRAMVVGGLESAVNTNGLPVTDGWDGVRESIDRAVRDGEANPRDMSDVGVQAGRGTRAGSSGPREAPPLPDSAPDTRNPRAARPAAPSGDGKRASRGSEAAAKHGGAGGEGGDSDDDPIDWAVVERCAAEPQNDTGNARRLIAHFGADMMRVRDVGPHYWAGTHWQHQGGGEAFQRFAQETGERIALEAEMIMPSAKDQALIDAAAPFKGKKRSDLDEEENDIRDKGVNAESRLFKRRADRRKFSISCGNSGRINGMIAQAEPHITVTPDDLDRDAFAINVLNGTVRLVKEKVRSSEAMDIADTIDAPAWRWRVRLDGHAREDRIAKVMPVEYHAGAKAPKWAAFMERFQPKAAIRRFLQVFHGYALTGMTGEQIFVFNYGLGANGKSTFMEQMARMMGDYAQVLPAEALTGDMQRRGDQATPEFARLPGARLVRCAELPRGQGFRESTLKLLTGGEAMLVRHLHERFFEMKPSFKAIGSGNDRPPIGGVDEGIWRRMRLVPWEHTIPVGERRPMEKVLAEFQAESAGILNWLLEGAIAYLEEGLVSPPEIAAATEDYRGDMDPTGEFTRACVEQAAGEDVTARDMYLAYTAWCHANSVKPYAEKGFAAIMTQKGFEKETGRIRKYKNVRLKDVPDDPEVKNNYSSGDWTRPG